MDDAVFLWAYVHLKSCVSFLTNMVIKTKLLYSHVDATLELLVRVHQIYNQSMCMINVFSLSTVYRWMLYKFKNKIISINDQHKRNACTIWNNIKLANNKHICGFNSTFLIKLKLFMPINAKTKVHIYESFEVLLHFVPLLHCLTICNHLLFFNYVFYSRYVFKLILNLFSRIITITFSF